MTHLFALSAAAADIMNISLRSRLSAARLTYIDSLHGTSRQQSFTASLLLDEAIRPCRARSTLPRTRTASRI